MAPPVARLVASLGSAVEPLVGAPEAVHAARIGGIGVVDDAVARHARAEARPLPRVGGDVRAGQGSTFGGSVGRRARRYFGRFGAALRRHRLAPEVVFDSRVLLLLAEPDAE